MEQPASLPLVALTAWQALIERANVRPGQKVLIQAGSGGVGTVAIQLAKHLGATVATTASADFLKDLGADIVIDYRTQDFETILSDYDVVLDSQGPKSVAKSMKILKRGGKVIGRPVLRSVLDLASLPFSYQISASAWWVSRPTGRLSSHGGFMGPGAVTGVRAVRILR